MSLVHNERVKLTANWLNAMASGVLITGVVAPAVVVFYGVPGPTGAGVVAVTIGSLIWLAAGTALHFLARAILGRLKP